MNRKSDTHCSKGECSALPNGVARGGVHRFEADSGTTRHVQRERAATANRTGRLVGRRHSPTRYIRHWIPGARLEQRSVPLQRNTSRRRVAARRHPCPTPWRQVPKSETGALGRHDAHRLYTGETFRLRTRHRRRHCRNRSHGQNGQQSYYYSITFAIISFITTF